MSKRSKRKAASGDVATNRRASHKYEFVERFEAGVELQGTEVKSLRAGQSQIRDAYAVIEDGEVWLRNAHIPPYEQAAENHDPERPRKLLLHRYEIERLIGRMQRKGLTLIPTRIYFKGARGGGGGGFGGGGGGGVGGGGGAAPPPPRAAGRGTEGGG